MAEKYWIGGTSGDWSVAANWSDAAVPVNSDTVVIDGRSTRAITSGLAQSAVTLAVLRIDQANLYNVGTATTPLAIGATKVEIGRPETSGVNAAGASLINLNFGTVQATIYVYNTNTTGSSGLEPFIFKGTHASNALHVYDGVVGIATALPADVATVATINIDGGKVRTADGCTFTAINVVDGELELESACTTLTIRSGEVTTRGTGAITTASVSGNGRLISNSTGTITNLHFTDNSIVDFSGSSVARTVTNATKHSDTATLNARTAAALVITFTNGVDCDRCSNTGIDFGDHVTVTPSAI